MRGKATARVPRRWQFGITPAYAGKSPTLSDVHEVSRDHPRLCGEKISQFLEDRSKAGSPPPMRGKGTLPLLPSTVGGITPAYAGKSLISIQSLFLDEDHPRLCGEKILRNSPDVLTQGSPPPMRGKVAHRAKHHPAKRITPAYAGKSRGVKSTYTKRGDHPRLCGEKIFVFGGDILCMGSPPPMRGKGTALPAYLMAYRITPAYAGKSRTVCGIRSKLEDHPRLCGEKHTTLIFMFSCSGSPPPMRGKEVDL